MGICPFGCLQFFHANKFLSLSLSWKGNLTAQNTRKPFDGRGSAPDPAEGYYSAPANPKLMGRGWLSPPRAHPRIRIVAAYSIRDSIRTEISDWQVPTESLLIDRAETHAGHG